MNAVFIERAVIGVAGAMVVFACLFRVWIHQSVIAHGYAISQARQESRELTKSLKALEVEYGALRSPDRLKTEADRLGLSPMAPEQLYSVRVEVSR